MNKIYKTANNILSTDDLFTFTQIYLCCFFIYFCFLVANIFLRLYNFAMRILVLAQSNGAVLNIERAIKKVSPDVIIHLGGGLKDFSKM